MRYVLMPDDLGPICYSLIPAALVTGAQVVIWRPSLLEIDKQFEQGKTIFNSSGFLELVRDRFIVVAGREAWFEGKTARHKNSFWDRESPWTDGLDEKLREIALEDIDLPLLSRRAVMAKPSRGHVWADEKIDLKHPIVEVTRVIVNAGEVFPGFLRRANMEKDETAKIQYVLASARNTTISLSEVGGDVPIQPSLYATQMALIGGRPSNTRPKAAYPELQNLIDCIYIVKSISNLNTFKVFRKYLLSTDRQRVLNLLEPIMMSKSSLVEIQSKFRRKNFELSWAEALAPSKDTAILGLLSIVFGLATGPWNNLATLGGIAIAMLGIPPKLAKKLNLVGLPKDEWGDLEWATKLHFGNRSPKMVEAQSLREQLLRLTDTEFKEFLKQQST